MAIYSTLFIPLAQVNIQEAIDAGWEPGPLVTGRSAYQMPALEKRRTDFYVNHSPLQDLLTPENRVHIQPSKLIAGSWTVDVMELVRVRALDGAGAREAAGYLLVHLAQRAGSREISTMTQLGELVRPDRSASRELMALLQANDPGRVLWTQADAPRVFALSLSSTPDDATEGSVRWKDSTAVDRRLIGLTALPPKSSIRITGAPEIVTTRPTPSFVLSVGRWTAAAVRMREAVKSGEPEPVRANHVV